MLVFFVLHFCVVAFVCRLHHERSSVPIPAMEVLHTSCESHDYDCPSPFGRCPIVNASTSESNSIVLSLSTNLTCGMCSRQDGFASYISDLVYHLKFALHPKCSDLIVYGVAFGSKYVEKVKHPKLRGKEETYSECSLIFLLEIDYQKIFARPGISGQDYFTVFVPIAEKQLPYKSMRRNTKLFKMHGHLLFPWAKRILWRDAKLIGDWLPDWKGKTDYFRYFAETVDKVDACAVVVTLPLHPHSVYNATTAEKVTFLKHCKAIEHAANNGRPDVSDDIKILAHQCQKYMDESYFASCDVPSLDEGMIDSALIAWNMKSSRCRDFAAEFLCTWSDETQRHSDRDQLSFAKAFSLLQLREIGNNPDPQHNHRVFGKPRDNGRSVSPVFFFVKGDCHWYYGKGSVGNCDFASWAMEDEGAHTIAINSDESQTAARPKNVAIVVAGTFHRYMLEPSLEHLISPLRSQGHTVDYFVSLTTKTNPAYRSDSTYIDHIVGDPLFGNCEEKSKYFPLSKEEIESIISTKVSEAGGTTQAIILQEDIDLSKNRLLKLQRNSAYSKHPNEDVDLRFPILDMRVQARSRTANANRNVLRLFSNVQQLWSTVISIERQKDRSYDIVIFLRDDTVWIQNFDLNLLLAQAVADVYTVSCDARSPPMIDEEMNDHIAIVLREKAEVFGNYINYLLDSEVVDKCSQSVRTDWRKQGRGCNSEMLLKWILQLNDVFVHSVGQSLIPFQRGFNVMTRSGAQLCFHKYCQSRYNCLSNPGIPKCKDLKKNEFVLHDA